MIRRLFLIAFLACASFSSWAALTAAQLVTLKAAILASTDPVVIAARAIRDDNSIRERFNVDSTFVVWKTSVTAAAVGKAMVSTEVGGLTTANTNRLMVMEAYSGGTFDPQRADTRAGFDAVFSGAGGVGTRAALLALYKRFATVCERVFATGTGSDAVPGLLVVEGQISTDEVSAAMNLP